MDYDRQAAVIANDLDSMMHRIESLQANPKYTEASMLVMQARMAVNAGRQELHQKAMAQRHGQVEE
jgi:hypothetical protein